ncbi:glycosyltransferase [Asanoa sp. WMMD1127]|uniref:glycosyltransferase n=1 Tax=Asanoa sp. WMMD1127 TaxID=3016107 RepID=UPI002416F671|nr:glycosyltransferase [Asanoa sp. WMMD1127]MDG4825806.1 glycosyltransferase [Asanoa sp. WMMD1127]
MRIAMISEHASPLAALGGEDAGGQNTHVADLASALAGEGHDVRVYTRRDGDLPESVRVRPGVTVVHVPAGPAEPIPKDTMLPHMGAFGAWLADDWARWRPDVAHAHFWMSGLAALTARKRTGVPVAQTYHALGTVKRRHQGDRDTSPPGRIGFERTLGRQADAVVAQCQDEVDELLRMGVPRATMSVIPSGVDSERFTPDGPVAPRTDRPRLLSIGRLVERKGVADVIAALPRIGDAELVVVGGPPVAELDADPLVRDLRAQAVRLGVDDRVRFVGGQSRDEVPAWYRSADIMVTTPWYEPFGLTPLEAMACGVPVVAAEVGGLTDTVVDGVTGDFVPPRDPAALADTVRRLLADPMRRVAYAAAALDRARMSYSWKRVAAQVGVLYDGLVVA